MKYSHIDFNNKTILILGGAGFIGSNLAFYFQKNYPEAKIIVFDKFRNNEKFPSGNFKSLGHFKNLIGFKGIVICGDIAKKEDLEYLNDYKIDYIFHMAAISDTTAQDQELVLKTNVNSFIDIIKLAKKNKAPLVYASSGAVYGNSKTFKLGFEQPLNIYGFSKLMMDNIAQEYMKKLDIPIVGLRYFNVYGPREYFKQKSASMVFQFAIQLLKGEKARLFEGSDKIKRDFVYIKDVIQATVKAASPKKSGIYNVGTGIARSFQDIVDILKRELNIIRENEYIPNPYLKQYQFFTQADIEDTKKYLDYAPQYSLEEGIKDYLPYIKEFYREEYVESE